MDVDSSASAPLSPALPALDPPNAGARIPAMRDGRHHRPPGCTLRPMRAEDLSFVVHEHLSHFPDSFFARLGPGFLATYTSTYLSAPHACAYIAEADGARAGYLIGITDPAAHRRQVLRTHGRRLALLGCAALARRPLLTLHFLRTRVSRYGSRLLPRRRRGQQVQQHTESAERTAVLDYIVVTRRARSRGLGATLIQHFTRDAAQASCTRAHLVTAAGADGAGAYYTRLGWRHTGGMRTPEGRALAVYELPLHTAQAQAAPLETPDEG